MGLAKLAVSFSRPFVEDARTMLKDSPAMSTEKQRIHQVISQARTKDHQKLQQMARTQSKPNFPKFASTLTSEQRNELPESDFALPEQRRFPIPDANHARAALSMMGRAKNLSEADKERIRAKAHAMLNKSAFLDDYAGLHDAMWKLAEANGEVATISEEAPAKKPGPEPTRDRAYYLARVGKKQDKNGWYVCTHRARSKSYPSIDDIPISKLKFIESTG